MESPTATRALATFITTGRPPEPVRAQALSAILDTVAVTIAGGVEPSVRRLASTLDETAGAHKVSCLWTGRKLRAEDAALLFGMAGHVLDYDDVSMLAVCHPSTPVLAAALCSIDGLEVSGRALVDAFCIGTEVMIRTGEAMGFRHYALGFHATATLGAIGAAATCARLIGLDEDRTAHALAIAATMSGGLRKNFGSMVKSLHVGLAASNGVRAARLAAAGVEGAQEVFEEEGFLNAFSGGETDHWPSYLALGKPHYALVQPGFEQKRYPCCYMLHKMIEGTLALRRDGGLTLREVAGVLVEMPVGGTKPLIHPRPRTGLNALFSAPYAVAASLEDGRIDLASFTDAAVQRPQIQARLGDVNVTESGAGIAHGRDIGAAPVTVSLRLVNGRTATRDVIASPGSPDDPLTDEQLLAKWHDCVKRGLPGITEGAAHALFRQGCELDGLPLVDTWLGALRAAARPH